jgi:hypothetical protein
MNIELVDFVRKALEKNTPRQDIADVLRKAGWNSTDIATALSAFAEIPFSVPVPKPKPYLSAREVFIYLILFSSMYAVLWSIGSLAFSVIEQLFPDAAFNSYFSASQEMRWPLSALIVALPAFLLMFHHTSKAVEANPALRDSKPRKWLTYITLYIAAFWVAGDLVAVVYRALGGELTVRFVLKSVVIGLLAGGTFSYFLSDMRKEEKL